MNRIRGAGCIGVGLAVLAMTAAPRLARGDEECIPAAAGVFGLNGPPDWSAAGVAANPIGAQLDDPRWNGSTRDDLPTGPSMPEVAFRAVQDGTKLYMSLQTIVDPAPGGEIPGFDTVYVGFASADGSKGELVGLTLNNTASSNVQDTTDLQTTAWHYAASTWATGPIPGWVEEAHIWAGTGTGATGNAWAVNLRAILATVYSDLGAAPGSPVKMFYALNVYTHASPGLMSVPIVWPTGSLFGFTGGVPDSTMLPSSWGTMLVGTSDPSCPTGIALDPEHIGTMPISSTGIPSTTLQYGGTAPDAGNTFVAIMDGPTPAANSVQANFRIADWGSQIGVGGDWKTILPAGPFPQNSDPAHPSWITWPCLEAPGSANPCPTLEAGAPPDQCLLVELSSTGGATPVHFIEDSARRNLDFVHASVFEREARVNLHGLAPLVGGSGEREVYLYVKTTNMPASVSQATDAGAPTPSQTPPRVARQEEGKLPPVYAKTLFETVRDSSATYEVHVYHETGRKLDAGKGPTRTLEPQVPFGYVVDHQGTLDGWKHQLEGRGVTLETVSPNFYRVRIPESGSVVVKTRIEALETPPAPPVSPPPPPWLWLVVALGIVLIVVLLTRGRRRAP